MTKQGNYHYGLLFFLVALGNGSLSYAQEKIMLKKKEIMDSEYTSMPVISNETLSDCSDRVLKLDITSRHLQEKLETFDTLKRHGNELEASRDIALKQLDLHDQKSVNQYNELNKKLNQVVSDLNTQAEQYNQEVTQYQKNIQQLKNECNNKLFYSE